MIIKKLVHQRASSTCGAPWNECSALHVHGYSDREFLGGLGHKMCLELSFVTVVFSYLSLAGSALESIFFGLQAALEVVSCRQDHTFSSVKLPGCTLKIITADL